MKKITILGLILIFSVMMLMGCSQGSGNDELVVGMELAYPPFETKDDKGEPMGVSVDFSKAFGEYIGKEVRIENIGWDGLIPAVQTEQVDMVISSMTIKEERMEKVDFSKPYAKALLAMLVNANSDIETMDDFNEPGRTIAVKIGSTGHSYAEQNLSQATIIPLPDESACVTEVAQGKADGFIYDQLTIYRNNKANPDTTKAIFIPFQDVEYWGVAVKKGNTELLDQLNAFIDEFYADGGFDDITEKFLKEEKVVFDELDFEWFFSDVNE
ncbi:transporter substrate-binding domain-containing protein [Alkalibacter rhizosphaerae]|uniref:Transporter substrate-binding domain-containing protein n=1 Tax=Alkalibacter rhizosphaerae TaxID=2815577 RepID=A0A974XFX9_9FIRM|nr:transporter substrate-binding domain-containing protein [Alkalibacter rhizosphaerae]QSX09088.1 transporter substrate-binding domain-containing protein [Alkalibacter rhizosphaerae]